MIKRLVVKPLTKEKAKKMNAKELLEYIEKEKEKMKYIQKKIKKEKIKFEQSLMIGNATGMIKLLSKEEMVELEKKSVTLYRNVMRATARLTVK